MCLNVSSILNLLNNQNQNIEISACTNISDSGIHEKLLSATLTYHVESCVYCKSPDVVRNGTRLIKVKLPSSGERPIHMNLRKQRYLYCICKHTFSTQTDIAPTNHSITHRAAHKIVTSAKKSLPVKTISKIVGISASSIQRILYQG